MGSGRGSSGAGEEGGDAMPPAPCPQLRGWMARWMNGWIDGGSLRPGHCSGGPAAACEQGTGWGRVPRLQRARRSNRSACVGGQTHTHIQIHVCHRRQTSPPAPAPRVPRDRPERRRPAAVPPHARTGRGTEQHLPNPARPGGQRPYYTAPGAAAGGGGRGRGRGGRKGPGRASTWKREVTAQHLIRCHIKQTGPKTGSGQAHTQQRAGQE